MKKSTSQKAAELLADDFLSCFKSITQAVHFDNEFKNVVTVDNRAGSYHFWTNIQNKTPKWPEHDNPPYPEIITIFSSVELSFAMGEARSAFPGSLLPLNKQVCCFQCYSSYCVANDAYANVEDHNKLYEVPLIQGDWNLQIANYLEKFMARKVFGQRLVRGVYRKDLTKILTHIRQFGTDTA